MTANVSIDTLVRAYYDAVTAGAIDGVLAMFAADAVMRDPVGAPPATDETARRQRYAGIKAMFDAFAITPEHVIVCGDEAAVAWTIRATAKSGRDITFSGISTFAFDANGRIAAMSAYLDSAAVAAALAS
jgi:steroid delta-isomerase